MHCFNLNFHIFGYIICFIHMIINVSSFEREVYLDLEHPKVTYMNPKFFSNVTLKSVRLKRGDPTHYVSLCGIFTSPADEKMKTHFYFYELLTNVYKRSFVEFHNNICQLFQKDEIVGLVFRNAIVKQDPSSTLLKCPIPAGEFKIVNLTVPPIPIVQNFPFREARIYINFTHEDNVRAIEGYIDMEVKPYRRKKEISNN